MCNAGFLHNNVCHYTGLLQNKMKNERCKGRLRFSQILPFVLREFAIFCSNPFKKIKGLSDQKKTHLLSPQAFDAVIVNYFIKRHT